MTVAPRSASIIVQNGPATTRVTSRTVIPDSGPLRRRLVVSDMHSILHFSIDVAAGFGQWLVDCFALAQ